VRVSSPPWDMRSHLHTAYSDADQA
jgi:hypothetical protein